MNVDTGQIYLGEAEIIAAQLRGEPIVELAPALVKPLQEQQQSIQRSLQQVNVRDLERAEHNLKRTQPQMSDSERRDLALRVANV